MANHSYSQASQDQFVYSILYELLDKQDAGYYLEIGAGHPLEGNNTYLFEKEFQWKGISIDISAEYKQLWNSTRQNLLVIEDATRTNYRSMLKLFPQVIDYLSLDIDGSYDVVLQSLPFNDYIFKVITIEHDSYRLGNEYKEKEREILTSWGYYLLCPDVTLFDHGRGYVFEDWWIHPNAFPADVFSKLISLDLQAKEHSQIIKNLSNLINPALKQVTRCAARQSPIEGDKVPVLNEEHHCQRQGRREKIDWAKPQQAGCHLFECRVNNQRVML